MEDAGSGVTGRTGNNARIHTYGIMWIQKSIEKLSRTKLYLLWIMWTWGDCKVHQCSAWNFTNQFVKPAKTSRVVLLTIINVLLLIKLFRAGGRLCKVCNFYQKLTLVSFSHVGDCSFKPSVTTKVAPGNTWFPNDHTGLYLLFKFRCVCAVCVVDGPWCSSPVWT